MKHEKPSYPSCANLNDYLAGLEKEFGNAKIFMKHSFKELNSEAPEDVDVLWYQVRELAMRLGEIAAALRSIADGCIKLRHDSLEKIAFIRNNMRDI